MVHGARFKLLLYNAGNMLILSFALLIALFIWLIIMCFFKLDKPTIKYTQTLPFQVWAYGAEGYGAPCLWQEWNKLHGATYCIDPGKVDAQDLEIMRELYKHYLFLVLQ